MTFIMKTVVIGTAGTAVQLYDTADKKTKKISVKAVADNEDIVYVGLSNVSATNGYALGKGEVFIFDRISLPTDVWVDAAESGDKVTWFADITDKPETDAGHIPSD